MNNIYLQTVGRKKPMGEREGEGGGMWDLFLSQAYTHRSN